MDSIAVIRQSYGLANGGWVVATEWRRCGVIEMSEASKAASDFWALVDKGRENECWEWRGAKNGGGYGLFRRNPFVERLSHRLAYVLEHGVIPDGMRVLHSCDNPPCCNPRHLSIGTAAENSRQMVERGRSTRGERHGMAKLTEDLVAEIRSRDGEPQSKLAEEFGVTQTMISHIMNGISWKDSYKEPSSRVDRTARGSRSGMSKLTEEQVRDIRSRTSQTQTSIAREFGVSHPTVSLIMRGITWKNGYSEPSIPRHPRARGVDSGNAKFTEDQIRDIRSRTGQSQQSIADEFGVSQTTISAILRGKTWSHVTSTN